MAFKKEKKKSTKLFFVVFYQTIKNCLEYIAHTIKIYRDGLRKLKENIKEKKETSTAKLN